MSLTPVLLEQIIEHLPNMIFVKEAKELRFVAFNKAGEDLLGLDRNDLLGKNDFDLFPAEQAEFFQEKDREVLAKRKTHLIPEEPIDTPTGQRWLRTRKVALLGPDGKAQFLLGISEDITETKEKNDELKRSKDELVSQSSFLRNTVDSLPGIFYAKNNDGVFLHINEEFRSKLELTNEQVIGKNNFEIFPKDIAASFRENDLRVIQEKRLMESEEIAEGPNGEKRTYHSFKFPYLDEQGEVYGTGGFSLDITEKKTFESQAYHASKLASIGELAAGVGHEINNPLTIAIGNVRKIKRYMEKAGTISMVGEAFTRFETATIRIARIVDGLRTFARPDSDEVLTFDVCENIEQSIDLLREIYEHEGICFDLELHKGQFFISGNLGRFQQAIMNLVSNARDALETVEDQKTLGIKVYEGSNDEVVVEVSDNGCGVKEDLKEKIFDSFFTTKELGKGTGIGLSLTSSIVSELDGRMELESDVGVGTKFILTFPRCNSAVLEAKTLSVAPKENDGPKVLLVDDEEEVREVLRDILLDLNCQVKEACDGKEALAKCAADTFDIVISDIKMPRMTGIELLKTLRTANLSYTPKIVLATGGITWSNTNYDDIKKEADDFITKPFEEEIIADIIRSLDKKKAA